MTTLSLCEKDGLKIVIDSLNGKAYCTQSTYGRICGVSRQAINKQQKSIKVKPTQIMTNSGLQKAKLVPISVEDLAPLYYQNPTENLYKVIMFLCDFEKKDTHFLPPLPKFIKRGKSKKISFRREKEIQLRYKKLYGGQTEFFTEHGRIDLLTGDTIFEMKTFREYKNCLGQLLAYNDCIPGMKLVAVLFCVPHFLDYSSPECKRIEKLFGKYGIEVRFER